MHKKGPPPINYATHPLRSPQALTSRGTEALTKTGPPPINYATHPLRSPLTSRGTEVALGGLSTNVTHSPARAVTRRRRNEAMYYSVIVGKCCGVYTSWLTVEPLVMGVPGSLYTGFRTYEGALWDYYKAKEEGKVKPVREPGDDFIFGSLSLACM